MKIDPRILNPEAIAELGERIYADRYKDEYESRYPGWFVAIEVNSGEAYPAEVPEKALELGMAAAPEGLFHLIKVGSSGAFRVHFVPLHGSFERLV
jgi:hypothetical protein